MFLVKLVLVAALWLQFAMSTHSENALSITLGGTVAVVVLAITEPVASWFWRRWGG